MNSTVRLTNQLAEPEKVRMQELFQDVFSRPFPHDLFERKYARSCLGHSWHSLLRNDQQIAGAFSAIPVRFRFFGQPRLFAISADLMVDKAARGRMEATQSMIASLHEALADAGIAFFFCVVRAEMRPFHERISKWRLIGKTHYYLAPLRASQLRWGAGPAKVLLRAVNSLRQASTLFRKPPSIEVEKIADAAFAEHRYGIFPVEYKVVQGTGYLGTYLTDPYYPIEGVPPGVRFALLLDVQPLTRTAFDACVRAIELREPDLDYLAYQGYLPFQPVRAIRVPPRFEKKAWYAMGRILRPDLVDERIFDIRRWNLNLSNGDLV